MEKALRFEKLQKTTLYEEATQQIKKAILGGDYRPGDHLPPERDLAKALGVGRPTVREALKILRERELLELDWATRRYVVKTPNLDNCVIPIQEQISWLIHVSENTIGDFWAVIPHILGLAAQAAVDTKTDEGLMRLSDSYEKMVLSGKDFSACGKASYQFGLDLAEMTGNRLILLLWKIFDNIIQKEFPPILSMMEPEGPKKLVDFHRRILDGVRKGNRNTISRAVMDRFEYLNDRKIQRRGSRQP